ncbi:MAG TPA: hypothetical protein VFG50_14245, partial [Rhodothermales bacterium]|nr:hypothetical protein [Rhodothermales bacterium]
MFESRLTRTVVLLLAFIWICHAAATECRAQAENPLHISGLAFLDYYYTIAAPDGSELEGQNGFTYRRLYLTADYKISEAFSGRARLEANDGSIQPFVKDLYLRWTLPSHHTLRFGIIPTPAVELSESVWGFRSLEKTPLDLFGFVSSRDMGVRLDGTAFGNGILSYNVMFANNNSVRPEDDPHKR